MLEMIKTLQWTHKYLQRSSPSHWDL